MGQLSRQETVATGETVLAKHLNNEIDHIQSDYNSNIDNSNIAAAAAIAVSKTTLGTFTDWGAHTVAWAGTGNPAIGNGTLTGRYTQIGGAVIYVVRLLCGATTTYGTANDWTFDLPVAAANAVVAYDGTADARDDNTTNRYIGVSTIAAAGTTLSIVNAGVVGATNTGTWGQTAPFTWANGDSLRLTITYEAA